MKIAWSPTPSTRKRKLSSLACSSCFDLSSHRGVAHERDHLQTTGGVAVVVEADVDGKFLAALACARRASSASPIEPPRRMSGVGRAVFDVTVAEPFGQQQLDRLADQVRRLVAEHRSELRR